MGYAILNISELENFDYSVRKSIDGNFFIIEGENVNQYTHEQILLIIQNSNWNQLI